MNDAPVLPVPAGWLPIAFVRNEHGVFADCRPINLYQCQEPFFDQDVAACVQKPFPMVVRSFVQIERLGDYATPDAQPAGIIFHSSRCGSTLISRMLQRPPRYRAVSEAPVLKLLLKYIQSWSIEQQIAAVRGLFGLFCRTSDAAPAQTFFKLESLSTLDIALIQQAFPATPWIFLYRDPLETLVSLAEKPYGDLQNRLDLLRYVGVDFETASGWSIPETAARCLGLIYGAGRQYMNAQGLLINYRDLAQTLFTRLPEHFRLEWSNLDRAHLRRLQQFHAKEPQFYFDNDTERKQRTVTSELRAAAQEWAMTAYQDLEQFRLSLHNGMLTHA